MEGAGHGKCEIAVSLFRPDHTDDRICLALASMFPIWSNSRPYPKCDVEACVNGAEYSSTVPNFPVKVPRLW